MSSRCILHKKPKGTQRGRRGGGVREGEEGGAMEQKDEEVKEKKEEK